MFIERSLHAVQTFFHIVAIPHILGRAKVANEIYLISYNFGFKVVYAYEQEDINN